MPPKGRGSKSDSKTDPAEEEDNPFRPSKDLRAEDETEKEEKDGKDMALPIQSTPPKLDSQPDNKIKFALKSKPSAAPSSAPTDLTQMARSKDAITLVPTAPSRGSRAESWDGRRSGRADNNSDRRWPRGDVRENDRPEPRRTERKLVKRIKPRPVLPPELAASKSVYFRKPGNESVVGSGTYGKVFRAIHVYTGEKVALKKIRMEGERDGVSHKISGAQDIMLINVVSRHGYSRGQASTIPES